MKFWRLNKKSKEEKNMKGTKNLVVLVALAILVMASSIVYAAPVGVLDSSVTGVSSSTRSAIDPYNISAQAGNVTEMNIDSITITNYWQGYYGNVTGTIVLADSSNATLYDWTQATASGQIYASITDQIAWAGIGCADIAEIEAEDVNIGSTGKTDSINNTFSTGVNDFFVGSVNVVNCRETNLHNSTGDKQTDLFSNVLLADADGDIVYTSILNDNALGFDNRNHDFQLIVAENGSNSNTVTTPYYFWVELV
jgi:hypothetical protein